MKKIIPPATSITSFCLFVLSLLLGLSISACDRQQPDATAQTSNDITDQLDTDVTEIPFAQHLLAARRNAKTTRALSIYLPNIHRVSAYRIQQATMEAEEETGDWRIGWKMGGTHVSDPDAQPDPSYGYSLSSHHFAEGTAIPSNLFVGDSILVEAEVAVYITKDLPGPQVTREQLLTAIDSIGGALELISTRLLPASDDDPGSLTMEHLIADNLSHAGVIFGTKKVPLLDIDPGNETVRAVIDGEEKASGSSRFIYCADPIGAVLWLANELPKQALHLRKGEFVITGSIYANPTLYAGQRADVTFSTLGTISVELMPVNQ